MKKFLIPKVKVQVVFAGVCVCGDHWWLCESNGLAVDELADPKQSSNDATGGSISIRQLVSTLFETANEDSSSFVFFPISQSLFGDNNVPPVRCSTAKHIPAALATCDLIQHHLNLRPNPQAVRRSERAI